MKTGVKILKHIINSIIWMLLVLYLVLITLTRIPSVQEYMGKQAAEALSDVMHTKVTVGKVNVGWLNRIVVNRIEVFDQRNKSLLAARRLAVRVDLYSLIAEGRIVVNSAQIIGADIRVEKPSADENSNIQFVLDLFASDGKKDSKPIDLQINSLIMRQCSLKYDRLDIAPTHHRFNPSHLDVSDISAYIALRSFRPDSIHLHVRRLALKESSGAELKRLSFLFEAGLKGCRLSDFSFSLPHTTFLVDAVQVDYQLAEGATLLKNFSPIDNSLHYQGRLLPSAVTLSDLSAFMPQFRQFDEHLNISATFEGDGHGMRVSQLNANSPEGDLNVMVHGDVKGWERGALFMWNLDLQRLQMSAKTLAFLNENLKGTQMEIPEELMHLGSVELKGKAAATDRHFCEANMSISSQAGQIQLSGSYDRRKYLKLDMVIPRLDVAKITQRPETWGTLAADIHAKGYLIDKQRSSLDLQARISQLQYLRHDYHHISLDAKYRRNILEAVLALDDPHGQLMVNTSLQPFSQDIQLQLKGVLSQLSPHSLNFTDKWGDARFSANIDAELSSLNIDKAQGHLFLTDFTMESDEQNDYQLREFKLTAGYTEEGERLIALNSDFAELEMQGYYTFGSLSNSFVSRITDKLPTLPWLSAPEKRPENRFYLWANIRNSDWMKPLLGVPLQLEEPMSINCKVNDSTGFIALHAMMPAFSYDDKQYRDGSVNMYSPGDSLHLDTSIKRIAPDGKPTSLRLWGNAADNHLSTSLFWNIGNDKKNRGLLNARSRFYLNEEGENTAEIQIDKSSIRIGDAAWSVEPSTIVYSKKNLAISNFAVRHQQQHLLVDGQATASDNDSIHVNLKGVDVSYVLNLVNFHSVEFGGSASGDAYVKAPFGDFAAHAHLQVEDFTFEQGDMGTLDAQVQWNQEEKSIDIHALADDGHQALTYIDGYVKPSPGHIDLNIKADGTKVGFIQSFTSSFTDYVRGNAKGEVRLAGPLSEINLTGELVVNAETFIRPLGCKYYLREDTIRLIPNEIEMVDAHLYDPEGHLGLLSGFIHHQHLTRLSYDLDISADNLLVYHFDDFGDDTFYGTIYGSGNVDLHGKSGELTMNVNVTPNAHSTFVYNVSSPDAISNQEFITWGEAQEKPDSLLRQNVDGGPSRRPYHHSLSIPNLSSDTYINFLFNCTPDLKVKLLMDARTNDYITLGGRGSLRASYYNKDSFNMFGTYQVENGTYEITIQEIIKKNFNFNPGGTIVFGGNPYDANLQLQAVHTVNGVSLSDLNIGTSFSNQNTTRVNCLMNISGQPRAPRVDFDIDLPTVSSDEKQLIRNIINSEEEMNQQVVYLLGIGRFYPQGANNAGMENPNQQSQTSLAMQSFLSGTLSSQVNSLLNTVVNNNNWNFGANISTGDEGWNNAEYEGLLSGRLLNNRLLINGQFGYRDNANTATSSFIGDFDVRYLLTPNGNFSVQVYNQTNDRYFTKSSLNTQGVGVIIKKDFGPFSDLFFWRKRQKKH